MVRTYKVVLHKGEVEVEADTVENHISFVKFSLGRTLIAAFPVGSVESIIVNPPKPQGE